MSERAEKHRGKKRKLEEIRHLSMLILTTEMATKVRNEIQQKRQIEDIY